VTYLVPASAPQNIKLSVNKSQHKAFSDIVNQSKQQNEGWCGFVMCQHQPTGQQNCPYAVRSSYTVSQKKTRHQTLAHNFPNVNRFSKFFHW